MLVGYADGVARLPTRHRHGQEICEDPAHEAAVERLLAGGCFRALDPATSGEVWVHTAVLR